MIDVLPSKKPVPFALHQKRENGKKSILLFTFKNVQKDHTISVVFNEVEASEADDVLNEAIFEDVDSSDWFYEDVEFVFENELMIGTSETKFSPNAVVNRAMLVTILWRLEENPIVEASPKFTDVPDDEWYTDAVNWASANGIVNGYGDGIFGAMNDLTREQIMAILNRYAAYKGMTDETITPMLPQYAYSTWAENNVILGLIAKRNVAFAK